MRQADAFLSIAQLPALDADAIATGIRSLIQVNAAPDIEYRLRVTCAQEEASAISVLISMTRLSPGPQQPPARLSRG